MLSFPFWIYSLIPTTLLAMYLMTHMVIVMHSALTSQESNLWASCLTYLSFHKGIPTPTTKKHPSTFLVSTWWNIYAVKTKTNICVRLRQQPRTCSAEKPQKSFETPLSYGLKKKVIAHNNKNHTESDLFQTNFILLPPIMCFNVCLLLLHNKLKKYFNCIIIVYATSGPFSIVIGIHCK